MSQPLSVTAKSPTRVDLAGGTLDIWPLNLLIDRPIVTINMAIDIFTIATVTARKDKKIILNSIDQKRRVEFPTVEKINHRHKLGLLSRLTQFFIEPDMKGVDVTTQSFAPAGAGLAGSSSLNISLVSALSRYTNRKLKKGEKIDLAKDIEATLLGVPTGLQDYGAAIYGGINAFSFPPGGVERERLKEAESFLPESLILFYSGASRNSGINNWEMYKRLVDKDKKTVAGFRKIADSAIEVKLALESYDIKKAAKAINKEWDARRALFPAISTPVIDMAISAGMKAGAKAARICGAGGGGCFFLLAGQSKRESVIEAATANGATHLPYKLSRGGSVII